MHLRLRRTGTRLMLVPVQVRMGMDFAGLVHMQMRVKQARGFQQRDVAQDLGGRTPGCDVPFVEDEAIIGNVFSDVEVVSCGDDGFAAAFCPYQEIDHVAGTLGVKRGGGLIEQQDFRVQNKH